MLPYVKIIIIFTLNLESFRIQNLFVRVLFISFPVATSNYSSENPVYQHCAPFFDSCLMVVQNLEIFIFDMIDARVAFKDSPKLF